MYLINKLKFVSQKKKKKSNLNMLIFSLVINFSSTHSKLN